MRSHISAPARNVLCRRRLWDSGLLLLLLAAHDASLVSLGSAQRCRTHHGALGQGPAAPATCHQPPCRGTLFREDTTQRCKARRCAGSCKHPAKAAVSLERVPAGKGQVVFPGMSLHTRSLYIHFQKNKGEQERSKSVSCVKLDYAWVAWILYNRWHDQT